MFNKKKTLNPTNNNKDNSIKNTNDPLTQISLLSDIALSEAEDAIISRQRLTKRFLYEIEKEIQEALKMLKFLGDPWKHGDKTDYEFMRISLDKALTSRKKERRERLLQSWKDLLSLNEKKIELLRENITLSGIGRSQNKESK